ncbi:Regulatory protein LysR [Pseudomonas syringae pv. papulans]|nr:Regulatory protein LysR [Pseudomonas syringae pv. papulans]RMN48176.1 Regulatory protein LysR [Pseudomonas syringae pv. papulans]RMV36108.1 Regulatory protein LysR [Pseudomonas syringae pv. papulans]
MDRIQEMTLFAGLAEQTSFAGVARHFGLSTATVTRAVASLESRLGILLVVRTTRNMRLTGRASASPLIAADCLPTLMRLKARQAACMQCQAAC